MDFNNQLPEWKNEGIEPSDELKTNGFAMKLKPPADIFNWFWSKVIKSITELQTKLKGHAENKENPHGVTKTQLGLDKVNNTSDSEKSVNTANFASESGEARKTKYALTIRFKGGDTENTDKWTFDGNTSKSINITPEKIKAADKEHTHSVKDINKVVVASSTDGVIYTANIEGITELYEGLEITICPNISNTSNAMTLNVNGLGDKPIRRPLSFSTYVADSAKEGFLHQNAPCRLMYHAEYPNRVNDVSGKGIWLMADKVKVSAQDLYGQVPVESGGTGASNAETARSNLGITPANIGAAATSHKHTKSEITDFPTSMTPTAHTHKKSEITDFPTSMTPTAHTHTKSQITDFPTSMTPTAHTHKKSEITDFPTSMTPTAHDQAASTITAGTFAGQVVANSSGQTPSTSLLRNSKLVSVETNPTISGEICWQYE